MANLYSSFVNVLDWSIKSLEKDLIRKNDKDLCSMYSKMICSFNFMKNVLIGQNNCYPDMIKFQNIMASLESLFMTYPMSNYEKGQLIRKFLSVDFEQSTNNINSIIYDKAVLDFSRKINMSVKETETYLEKYFNNSSREKIPDEIKEQIKTFLKAIEQENIDFVQKYNDFKESYLNIDANFEFTVLKEKLSELNVPTSIVNYYYVYCKEVYDKKKKKQKSFIIQEEKKEIQSEKTYSRKELKSRLLKYCNLGVDSEFDYKYYDEVLSLLSALQLADNMNAKYFNYCYQNRIENKDYYKYLLLKIRDNFKYQETVNLITWYKENIESEEDKIAAYQEIYEILKSVPDIEMLNFDYEMTRVRKK